MTLTCEQITAKYGDTTALNGVTFTLRGGELVGLVGPNGAGKTTLMRILATLLKPSAGDVTFDNVSIVSQPKALRGKIGFMPQDVAIYPHLTADEFLRYMAEVKGIRGKDAARQIEMLLARLHLEDTGKKRLGVFSGGMRQRIGVATALLGDPQVIIVDEPTAGLDPLERVSLRSLLVELAAERIVLLSTHIVTDVEAIAGHLLLLKEGKLLYDGGPAGILAKAGEGASFEDACLTVLRGGGLK